MQAASTELFEIVRQLAVLLQKAGGRALLVGGCVRDELLGAVPKDYDLEVYGLHPDRLQECLRASGFDVELVGRAFGVLKLKHLPIELSIPRRETKTGPGHTAFDVDCDPFLTTEKAALRRDFTINAISKDPLTGELLDFYGGLDDLRNKRLEPVSEKFMEDPLRVLRAMQFIARFELSPSERLLAYSRQMTLEGLARERIFDEFAKWLLQGRDLKRGLEFLRDSTWIRFFPELAAMVGAQQDPEWHPEGDVFTHTGHCLNAYAMLRSGCADDDLALGFAVLLHDVAKPVTTAQSDGRLRSFGHEEAGAELAAQFMRKLTAREDLIQLVARLVREHMAPVQLYKSQAGPAAVRRLALRVGRLDLLAKLVLCDQRGRPPIEANEVPAVQWLQKTAEQLDVAAQKPRAIILGRHLMALGVKPGPQMGALLKQLFDAQLDGRFSTVEEGVNFAKMLLAEKTKPPQQKA